METILIIEQMHLMGETDQERHYVTDQYVLLHWRLPRK